MVLRVWRRIDPKVNPELGVTKLALRPKHLQTARCTAYLITEAYPALEHPDAFDLIEQIQHDFKTVA
jgi:hypothetical protein